MNELKDMKTCNRNIKILTDEARFQGFNKKVETTLLIKHKQPHNDKFHVIKDISQKCFNRLKGFLNTFD